jgi:hypothetical protein
MNIQQLRQYRIFGLALFDLVTSFVGLILIFLFAWKMSFSNLNPLIFILFAIILTIPVGIAFHVVFGVNTSLNYQLGLSNKP